MHYAAIVLRTRRVIFRTRPVKRHASAKQIHTYVTEARVNAKDRFKRPVIGLVLGKIASCSASQGDLQKKSPDPALLTGDCRDV